jgi:hypothetical protein
MANTMTKPNCGIQRCNFLESNSARTMVACAACSHESLIIAAASPRGPRHQYRQTTRPSSQSAPTLVLAASNDPVPANSLHKPSALHRTKFESHPRALPDSWMAPLAPQRAPGRVPAEDMRRTKHSRCMAVQHHFANQCLGGNCIFSAPSESCTIPPHITIHCCCIIKNPGTNALARPNSKFNGQLWLGSSPVASRTAKASATVRPLRAPTTASRAGSSAPHSTPHGRCFCESGQRVYVSQLTH